MTASNRSHLARIAKRLVRYNTVKPPDSRTRRMQYSCEKCGKVFDAWKHLRQHKVEDHSY
jgi:hypothetical protein